jgi:DNA (cytosine-5)-methyltransferase 1
MAGKRKGKDDERHLWPEMLRCIREVKPRWVIGENVLGLVNWSGGLVFHEVQADLEAQGYEVFPYVLPAAAVNAPHRRDRVWFVAFNTKSIRSSKVGKICKRQNNEPIGVCKKDFVVAHAKSKTSDRLSIGKEKKITINGNLGSNGDVTYTNGIGLRRESDWIGKSGFFSKNEPGNYWQTFPTVSPLCAGDDGFSSKLDGITFSKWRKESIKAGGNAIVPQVAFQIFKTIEQYETIL